MQFTREGNVLVARHGGETLCLEPWGKDSLRVRAWMFDGKSSSDWALADKPADAEADVFIGETNVSQGDGSSERFPCASIRNGRLLATVNYAGVLTFYRDDQVILREYYRSYGGTIVPRSRCLKIVNREWKGISGASEYQLTVRFLCLLWSAAWATVCCGTIRL